MALARSAFHAPFWKNAIVSAAAICSGRGPFHRRLDRHTVGSAQQFAPHTQPRGIVVLTRPVVLRTRDEQDVEGTRGLTVEG